MILTQQILRRNFFASAAATASCAMFAQETARGDEAPRKIELGFSLYGMKSLALDDALRAVAKIGYECVELPVMPGWPADSARLDHEARRMLRAELAERRLRLTSLMENLPALGDETQQSANIERLKLGAQLARDLAPIAARREDASPPLIETILGGKPGEFDAAKDRLVSRLRDWAKVLAEAEVVLAIKAHIGNATQRPEQLNWLLESVASPWLKAAYDYSHFQLQDLEMGQTLRTLLPRTVFVHVKDTEHAQSKRGFLLPGEGTIDYAQLFKLLGQSSYRGDVVVEVSSQVFNRPGYDPLAAAQKCYEHLSAARQRAL